MSGPENNPTFRKRDPNKDITFDLGEKKVIIPDLTFIKTEVKFLPLCKTCVKSPMTCDNDFIRKIEVPMEPGDDPKLEVKRKVRLPSGEMSEEKGLGFKRVDGVYAGFYKTENDLPKVFVC